MKKTILLPVTLSLCAITALAAADKKDKFNATTFTNPILAGDYPDPSIAATSTHPSMTTSR